MNPSSAITGIGLVTPLADTARGTWDALLANRFITDHAKVTLPDVPAVPRVTALARRAAAEAVRNAGWTAKELSPSTALIIGTSKGPVEDWLGAPHVYAGPCYGLASVATDVASSLGINDGPRLTLSAACASGLHALIRAAMMIRFGECDRAIVVAAEASVHPLFIGSFRRLGVLPPEGFGCRPFDQNRAGFLMSEAGAAICLERDSSRALVHIENYAMGADATHLTSSDPSGKMIRRLLNEVVQSQPIDLIHAHGTGTEANDAMELNAIESICGDEERKPAVYSHKGAIGHSLGAAGLISVVINCIAHREEIVPPNVRLSDPLAAHGLSLRTEASRRPINRSLALAAGFGGPMAAVSLRS